MGTTYSSGCTGTEPLVDLDSFAVGDDISLTANGIIAKGGTVNSTYITLTEKTSYLYGAKVRINETSGSGAHYILYLDEAGSLGACNTSSATIIVSCPS